MISLELILKPNTLKRILNNYHGMSSKPKKASEQYISDFWRDIADSQANKINGITWLVEAIMSESQVIRDTAKR